MPSDRAILQEILDEQLDASRNAGEVAARLGPVMGALFAAVEISCMRRALVLAALLPYAGDTPPAPPPLRLLLAFDRDA